jgi:hypothetical protein
MQEIAPRVAVIPAPRLMTRLDHPYQGSALPSGSRIPVTPPVKAMPYRRITVFGRRGQGFATGADWRVAAIWDRPISARSGPVSRSLNRDNSAWSRSAAGPWHCCAAGDTVSRAPVRPARACDQVPVILEGGEVESEPITTFSALSRGWWRKHCPGTHRASARARSR